MLKIEQEGPVLQVKLNRPEVRNAFNGELILSLTDAFKKIPEGVRVLILSGEGPAFSAGGDLEWMQKCANDTFEKNEKEAFQLAMLFQGMMSCPVPVITKAHGAVFGGGCGLIAASDIVVAEKETKFAFSEVKLGLIPAVISGVVVPKIGSGFARSLFVTGEVFSAERAYQIGLVHDVLPLDKVDQRIDALIDSILSAGPNAVAEAKTIAQESPLSMEEAAKRLAIARTSAEGREGICAFLEKRKPSFVHQR